MKPLNANQPRDASYVSDRTQGCSCAYLFHPQSAQQRRRPRGEQSGAAGVFGTDVLESASGARFTRPPCHGLLTGNGNASAKAPAAYRGRNARELFFEVTDALRRALWRFVLFVSPRINPSIGLSFWQWRAR